MVDAPLRQKLATSVAYRLRIEAGVLDEIEGLAARIETKVGIIRKHMLPLWFGGDIRQVPVPASRSDTVECLRDDAG